MKEITFVVGMCVVGFVFGAKLREVDFSDNPYHNPATDMANRSNEIIKNKLNDRFAIISDRVMFNAKYGNGTKQFICGQVFTNGLSTRFVSSGESSTTWIESQVSNFDVIWNKICD
jgi:hypothetical protein